MTQNQQSLRDHAARAVGLAMKAGATACDAIAISSADLSAGIRNGVPETIERAESRGVGLRVFVGQSSASLSTSEFSETTLNELAEKAVAIAKVAPPDPYTGLADPALLATKFPDLDLADAEDPSMEMLQQNARRAEEAGRSQEGITNSEGGDAGFGRSAIAFATSHGFAAEYSLTRHSVSASMIAGAGDGMQRDYDYCVTAHLSDLPAPEEIGADAARRTLERMNPRKITSRTAPIYFEPRIAKTLISAFASAIHGSSVARGTSFLKDALGTDLFSRDITIIDDPLRPRGLSSRAWDGEGVAAKKMNIVEQGRLTTWLLDCRSARQLGLQTTGHATRGMNGPPHPASSNMHVVPSQLSPQQLMQQMGDGLYVTETIGHGANMTTGDYSLGASGFWIENGERAYPVSEITIAGNLRDMFKTLAVANDLEFRYSTNTPTIAIPAMTIAGN